MQVGRWTAREVIVVGPSGRVTHAAAKVFSAEEESGTSGAVSIGIMVVMLSISVFVPPVLLLNIPILIARAALTQTRKDWHDQVAVDGFACPECGGHNPPQARKGALPVSAPCAACAVTLSVQQRPRVNLVIRPNA